MCSVVIAELQCQRNGAEVVCRQTGTAWAEQLDDTIIAYKLTKRVNPV